MVGGFNPNPSEKYEFVNWDDDIPNISGKITHVPNHQGWTLFRNRWTFETHQIISDLISVLAHQPSLFFKPSTAMIDQPSKIVPNTLGTSMVKWWNLKWLDNEAKVPTFFPQEWPSLLSFTDQWLGASFETGASPVGSRNGASRCTLRSAWQEKALLRWSQWGWIMMEWGKHAYLWKVMIYNMVELWFWWNDGLLLLLLLLLVNRNNFVTDQEWSCWAVP